MVHQKASTRPKEIYGITGAKGHGKDTLARLIIGSGTQGAGFAVTHFAAALKKLCMDVFGLTDYDVNDPVGKEKPLRSPIVLDDSLAALRRITGLPIRAHNKIAKTPRELLQLIGSEYIRSERGTYWLDQLTPLLEAKRRVLVPDARFPNEAAFIRQHGGRVIRVIRIDAEASGDGHMSETEGLKIEADLTLGVRTGGLSLVERVAHLLSKGKWESAMRYDYRRIQTAIALYQSGATLKKCVNAIGVKNDDSQAFRCILTYYGIPQRRPGTAMNPHRFEDGVEQKQCRTCSTWQPLASFSKNSKAWDRLHWVCKTCASVDHKRRYILYEKDGSFPALFREAKMGAAKRALPFNLTQSDLEALWEKQGKRCFYTKEPMVLTKGAANKVSVDRLDSTIGYEIGNVVLCCSRVNLMKGPLSLDEFKDFIERLAANMRGWGRDDTVEMAKKTVAFMQKTEPGHRKIQQGLHSDFDGVHPV